MDLKAEMWTLDMWWVWDGGEAGGVEEKYFLKETTHLHIWKVASVSLPANIEAG